MQHTSKHRPMIGERKKRHGLLAALALLLSSSGMAQLAVSPQADLDELARTITGPGVQIFNPQINCHPLGFGEFNYNGSLLGINDGVLLTTGSIDNAIGANNVENRSFQQGTPGNALLNTVTGRTTYDACRFEFDIIPGGDTLRFNFTFASEEYNEWVGSQYNDVFGFFISGPGITPDPGIAPHKNIALIPGTDQAVAINNVNNAQNNSFYFDNAGGPQIQYDGLTQQLQAMAVVQPCQTYHLMLVVADAADRLYDSGVFIERIQSNAVSLESFTAAGFPNMVEGCNDGWVRFTRQHITNEDLDVTFYLGGTATNGLDYPLVGSDPDPLVPKTITIPANEGFADLHFAPIPDGIPEGAEHVTIYLGDPNCPGAVLDSLEFAIQDSLFTAASDPVTICSGDGTQLEAGGGMNYAWSPATGLNDPDIAAPLASPDATTTYTATITAGDCVGTATTTVTLSNMSLATSATQPLCNGGGNGAIDLGVQGGIAPYQYSWTGPNGFTANSEDLVNIGTGSYTVTVTDAAGCTAIRSTNVNSPAVLTLSFTQSILPFGQNISCAGGNDGWVNASINGGTGPYSTNWTGPNGFVANTEDLMDIGAGTYTLLVTDANGCSTDGTVIMAEPQPLEATTNGIVGVECFDDADGTANATVQGGIPPYSYSWNSTPVQEQAQAVGLAAGNYTVTITDGYGCISTAQAVISGPDAALSVSLVNVNDVFQCQGNNNPHGSATAVASGGTAPYSLSWNTSPPQDTPEAIFTTGGTYTVNVTDALGCNAQTQLTVTQPGDPVITFDVDDVSCGGADDGSATVIITGGSNVQSISWNTTPPQNGATASGLAPGTYTMTALHADGCESMAEVTIDGATQSLTATVIDVVGESCFGAADGAATVQVQGGTEPYDINWASTPPQGGTTASGLSAGMVNVSITDANGCPVELTASIPGPEAPLALEVTDLSGIPCFEGNTGSATVLANGGTAPYTYAWDTDPPQSGPQATELIAGTYDVTVNDANGCTATIAVILVEPELGVNALVEQFTNESCYGAADGWATIDVSGGSGAYTIVWNTEPPQFGATATGLAPGTYTASVDDNNGCDHTKTVQVEITGATAPLGALLDVSDFNGYNASCSDAADGWIDMAITGGTAPYLIIWSDAMGGTTGVQSPSGLDQDTYTLELWDINDCYFDTTLVFTAPPPIVIDAEVETVACQGSPTGSVSVTISGGLPGYTLSWTGPNGFTANSGTITDLASGAYVLSVTDQNDCTVQQSFNVNEPGIFNINANISAYGGGWNLSCTGANDGTLFVHPSGGTEPYDYSWTGPAGYTSDQQFLTDLIAGTYTLTLTDDNGCTTVESWTLTAPPPVSITLNALQFNGYQLSCNGANDGAVTTTIGGGTAPYTVAWNGPGGFASNNADISGLAAGGYAVFVTDANGCTANLSITLNAPPVLAAQANIAEAASGDGIDCHGAENGSIALAISGGVAPYEIVWNGPGGFTNSDPSIDGLAPGTYTANIIDANGCATQAEATITEPDPIVLDATISSYIGDLAISCTGATDGAIDLDISGGAGDITVAWTGPNGYSAGTEDISGLEAGTYIALVTDMNGCTATASIVLEQPDALELTPLAAEFNGAGVSCAGAMDGSITLGLTGGTPPFSQEWSGPDGFTSTDADLTDLGAGTYSVTVTDANGCDAQATITLETPAPLTIDAIPFTYIGDANVSCAGASDGSIDLTISGGTPGYDIQWTDGQGFFSDQEDISALAASLYSLTVADANGCTADAVVQLTPPQVLEVSADASTVGDHNVSCDGALDGSITLEVTGGTGPYTHTWNTGETSADLNGIGAGTYTVEVTDANGCTASTGITLSAPEPIAITLQPTAYIGGYQVSCAGTSDGGITSLISGGTAPFGTAWTGSNGFSSTDADLADLPPGTYTLTVTDINGCTGSTSVTLAAPAPITIQLGSTTYNGGYHIGCHGATNGAINSVVNGGEPAYTYAWSGPDGFTSTLPNPGGLAAGTYALTITDALGCTATNNVTLVQPEALQVDLTLSDAGNGFQVGCIGNDGAITTTVSGGTSAFEYDWSGPNGFASMDADISGLVPGTYELLLTDANGCTIQVSASLTQADAIQATFANTPNLCPGDATGAIGISLSGGITPFSFAWTGPDGFTSNEEAPMGLAEGNYGLVVTDAAGCQGLFSTAVTGPAPLGTGTYVSFFGNYNLQCLGDSSGVIELNPQGGTAPYVMNVNGPGGYAANGNAHTGLVAGDYLVSITDAHGCAMDSTITLTEPELPIDVEITVSVFPSGTNISCYGHADGWITATAEGGAGDYSFVWRGPDSLEWNTPTVTGLTAGDYAYELVVTDGNQCTFTTLVTLTQPDTALFADLETSNYNGSQVSCADSEDGGITLNLDGGNGGYAFAWSGPQGFSSNDQDLEGLPAGNYTVLITDMNGCELEETVTLAAPATLAPELTAFSYPGGTTISCHGANNGSISAAVNGGTPTHALAWTGPNGFTHSNATISGLAPGTYCLQVTDANNCVAQACTEITEPQPLALEVSSTGADCGEPIGTVDLTVSGGSGPFTYAWDNGAQTQDLNDLAAGFYGVTVIDANGCTAMISATVPGTPAVSAEANVIDNLCNGGNDGAIDLSVIGGAAPFTYAWSNGASSEDLFDLPAGDLSVVVTDANGCNFEHIFTVGENAAITIDATLSEYHGGYNVSPYQGSNGSITLGVSGGEAPYSYAWSTGATGQSIGNLTAGEYAVEVTDAYGCNELLTIVLTQPDDLAMPTGFTPNGDGHNDAFFVQGLDAYLNNQLVIINRWGNVVFERPNYRNDWRGENMQGGELPNGTYFAILRIGQGERTLQNYVDLRR